MSHVHLPLAALSLVASLSIATGASCATREAMLDGTSLLVSSPCARAVQIRPDPTLNGRVALVATAEHQEELDRLVLDTAGAARVRVPDGRCWHQDGERQVAPTLDIVLRVPASFPLTIDEAGAGKYVIGAVAGSLSLDISGDAHVAAEQVTKLNLDLSGSGGVELARVVGDVKIDLSGHGSLSIGDASIDSLAIGLSGAGKIDVAQGHVRTVSIDASGTGDVHLGGETGDANLDISGLGAVRIAKLSGALHKEISGMGTVKVGQ